MPSKVFISHAGSDASQAMKIAEVLSTTGISVILDRDEIVPGSSIIGFMESALLNVTIVYSCGQSRIKTSVGAGRMGSCLLSDGAAVTDILNYWKAGAISITALASATSSS